MSTVSAGDQLVTSWGNAIVNALKGTVGENLTVFAKGADLASAAALSLGTDGNYFDITGTTNITSISSLPSGTVAKLQFDGALTIVHNATSLILSGGVSYLTAAGDVFEFVSEGSGNWRETHRSLSAINISVASTFGATPSLAFSTTNTAGTGTGFVRRNAQIALFDTTLARALAFGDVGTVGSIAFPPHADHGHPMPGFATPNLTLSTTWTEGNATTPIRSNAQLAFFDTTAPTTLTFGDVGSAGSAAVAARRDHGHPFASGATIVASVNNVLNVASTNGNLRWSALSAAPSGSAGGELAGTYPNPTVASTHSGSTHVVKEVGSHEITTEETTTSTSSTDLTTVGPTVTMTAALNDKMNCHGMCYAYNSGVAGLSYIAPKLDAAAVTDSDGILVQQHGTAGSRIQTHAFVKQFASLSAASHTVKIQYKVDAGTGTFGWRKMLVYRST